MCDRCRLELVLGSLVATSKHKLSANERAAKEETQESADGKTEKVTCRNYYYPVRSILLGKLLHTQQQKCCATIHVTMYCRCKIQARSQIQHAT